VIVTTNEVRLKFIQRTRKLTGGNYLAEACRTNRADRKWGLRDIDGGSSYAETEVSCFR
jgi:hypothetical protein